MKVGTEPIIIEHNDLPADEQPTVMRSDAREREITYMLNAPTDVEDDGRSQWQWFRLPNGDLIFGTFPQGDTYISMVDGGVDV